MNGDDAPSDTNSEIPPDVEVTMLRSMVSNLQMDLESAIASRERAEILLERAHHLTTTKQEDIEELETERQYRKAIVKCTAAMDFADVLKKQISTEVLPVDSVGLIRRVVGPNERADDIHILAANGVYRPQTGSVFPTNNTLSGNALKGMREQYSGRIGEQWKEHLPPTVSGDAAEAAFPLEDGQGGQGVVLVRKEGNYAFGRAEVNAMRTHIERFRDELALQFRDLGKNYDDNAQTVYKKKPGMHRASNLHKGAHRDQVPLMIAFFDLDDFKHINEQIGHQNADEILYKLGLHIGNYLDSNTVSIRFGGDEFIRVSKGLSYENCHNTLRKIVDNINSIDVSSCCVGPFDKNVNLGVSVGVVYYEPSRHGFQALSSLISYADRALLDGKKEGKNAITRFPDSELLPVQGTIRDFIGPNM